MSVLAVQEANVALIDVNSEQELRAQNYCRFVKAQVAVRVVEVLYLKEQVTVA